MIQAGSEILINVEESLLKILHKGGDAEENIQALNSILENTGVISTLGKLQVQVKSLVNSGTLKGKEVLLAVRSRLHNQAGASIEASEILSFLEKSAKILNEGDLLSKKILKAIAQKFDHAAGRLVVDREILLEAVDLYLCGDIQASQDLTMLVENEFMYKTATLKADGTLMLTLLNGEQIRQNIHTPGNLALSLQDASTTYQLDTLLVAGKDLTLTTPGKVVINHLPLKAGQDITITAKGFMNKRSIEGREVSITAEEAGIEFGGSKEALQARCKTSGNLTLNAPKGQVSHLNSKTEVAGEVKSHSETALIGEAAEVVVQGRYESVTQGKTVIIGTLKAEDALLSSLCDDVHLLSLKSRSGNGENFNETILNPARVEVRGILEILSRRNVIFEAAHTHSGLRTHIQALGAILDLPVILLAQRVEHFYHRKSHGTNIDRYHHEQGSIHRSGGAYQAEAGGEVYLHGVSHEAQDVDYSGQKATIQPAVDRHEHFSHEVRKKRAWHGGRKTTVASQASSAAVTQPVRFKVAENLKISGEDGVEVGAIHSTAKRNLFASKKGQVSFLLGCHAAFSSSMTRSTDMLWQRMSSESRESRAYFESIIPGEIEIQAERVLLQRIQGQTLSFMQNIKQVGATITFQDLQNFYHHEVHTVEGPSTGLAVLTTIVVSALTAGSGAAILGPTFAASHGVLTAAFTAGIQTVCSQAAIALLSNAGDPGKALKLLLSSDSLKSLAIAMLGAGLMKKVGASLNISAEEPLQQAKTGLDEARMLQNAKLFLAQNCIDSMLRISFSREKFEQAVKQGILNTLISTLGAEASSMVGASHQAGDLGTVGHKVSHAIIGGACGTVAGGKKGAVAGAAGAVVAELTAGLLKSDDQTFMKKVNEQVNTFEGEQNRPSTKEERFKIYQNAVKNLADKAKIISGVVSLFLRQDVSIATQTAAQAVEHNFTPSTLGNFSIFEEAYQGRSRGFSSNRREGFQPAEDNEEDLQEPLRIQQPKRAVGRFSAEPLPDVVSWRDLGHGTRGTFWGDRLTEGYDGRMPLYEVRSNKQEGQRSWGRGLIQTLKRLKECSPEERAYLGRVALQAAFRSNAEFWWLEKQEAIHMAYGTGQMILSLGNSVGVISQDRLENHTDNLNVRLASYRSNPLSQSWQAHVIAVGHRTVVGGTVSSLFFSSLPGLASSAAAGGVLGLTEPTETGRLSAHISNGAEGASLALGVDLGFRGAGRIIRGLRGGPPNQQAVDSFLPYLAAGFRNVSNKFAEFGGRLVPQTEHYLPRAILGGRLNYLSKSIRNDLPLTELQKLEIINYAEQLGFPREAIYFYENMNLSYGKLFGKEILNIGPDVLPSANPIKGRANARVSMKAAIAHELVGHRAAELAGKTHSSIILEEAQASIRAARFAPDLNNIERFVLLRDALERLRSANLKIKDIKSELWIEDASKQKLGGK